MPRKKTNQTIWQKLNNVWLRFEFKHTVLAISLIVVFVAILDTAVATALFTFVEDLGYLGSFIAGLLSVSFFTAVPAVALLVDLANEQPPVMLALVAAAGSMLGDWLILLFFDERIARELRPVFQKLGLVTLLRGIRRYKATSWLFFLGGTIVLSTPVPDEIGIAMLGISHFNRAVLLAIAYVCNFVGILVLALAVRTLT